MSRRERFRDTQLLLPRVLHADGAGSFRPLDYDRDILGALDWGLFSIAARADFTPDDRDRIQATFTQVEMTDNDGRLTLPYSLRHDEDEADVGARFRVHGAPTRERRPEPVARRADSRGDARGHARAREIDERRLAANRLFLLDAMTTELRRGVDEAAEALFRMKLDTSDITFRLVSAGDPELNWRLAETMNFNITDRDRVLTKQDGAPLERCLFERVYERDFNTLERGVAWYLDDADAVAWWHRLVAKQDYHLQGWQREKVYPDFLACITSNEERLTFSVLEIKGAHLGGNDDTAYKEHLFDILMRYYDQALEAGEIELETGENQRMVFKIIFESTWRSELGRLTADPAGAR